MRVIHSPRDRRQDLHTLTNILGKLADFVGKRTPVDELHRKEGLPFDIADFIDRHNAWMVQRRCSFRFNLKSAKLQLG